MSWNLPLQLSKLVRNPYNVDMNFLQDVDVSGNLKVYGSADISGGIVVFMDLSDVLLDGNDASGQNIVGVGTYSGINADLSGDLDVSGNTTIYGNTDIYGDFGASENTVAGQKIINSTSNTFTVQDYAGNWAIRVGDGTTNPATARNVLLCASAGQVNVGVDPTYNTSLNVYGLTETTDLSVNNNLDVSANATIYGYTRIFNDMSVNGFIDVSGSVNIFTDCDVSNNLTVFGQTNCEDNLNVKGNCDISGNIGFCNDIATNDFTSTGVSNLGATTINTSLTLTGYITGDMIQSDSAGVMQKIPIGTNGDFLTVVGGVAAWSAYTPTTETLQQTLTAGDDANNLNITNLNTINVNNIYEQSSGGTLNIGTSSTGNITITTATTDSILLGNANSDDIIIQIHGLANGNNKFTILPATLKWKNSNPATTNAIQSLRLTNNDNRYVDCFIGQTDGNNNGSIGLTCKNPYNSSYVSLAPSAVSGIEKWSFTAQHQCQYEEGMPLDYSGLIVECVGNIVGLYEIPEYGINKNNFSNASPIVKLCQTKKSKKILGVIKEITEEPNTTKGDLTVQWNEEGYTKGDKRVQVNCIGEGLVWVVNTSGNIEVGDLITSSNVAGYGEKQDDDLVHSYTLGKSTFNCDFIQEMVPKKKILKDEEGDNILDPEGRLIWVDSDELIPKYEMRELEDGVKAVLISIVYYSG